MADDRIVFARPRDGATIIQPNRNFRQMPREGDFVDTFDVFYTRLLLTGDLVRCDPPSTVVAATPQPEPTPAEHAPRKRK